MGRRDRRGSLIGWLLPPESNSNRSHPLSFRHRGRGGAKTFHQWNVSKPGRASVPRATGPARGTESHCFSFDKRFALDKLRAHRLEWLVGTLAPPREPDGVLSTNLLNLKKPCQEVRLLASELVGLNGDGVIDGLECGANSLG
jgi:hypothetical protein